jgi:hypothetical protein
LAKNDWSVKDSARVFEIDAMLAQVDSALFVIPLESGRRENFKIGSFFGHCR